MSIIGGADGPTSIFLAPMGWLNTFGLIIVALLMIPNIIWALRHRGEKNKCANRLMNALEQIGRYGCMLFMAVCFMPGGFGFASADMFIAYLIGNAALIAAYYAFWIVSIKHPTAFVHMALAVLPTAVFLLCGITLGYWPLIACAALFGVAHIYVTYKNQ